MDAKLQEGFSLLELLISLVIFTLGLFALVKLVALANQLSQANLWRALAQNELLNGRAMAQGAMTQWQGSWQQEVQQTLPGGKGYVDAAAGRLQVAWRQPQDVNLTIENEHETPSTQTGKPKYGTRFSEAR